MSRKLKLIKNGLIMGATIVAISFAPGCGKKEEKETKKETKAVVETVTDTAVEVEDKVTFEEVVGSGIEDNFYLNSDDEKTALTIMNIDYIIVNYPELLQEVYPNGLNSDKELKDFETFMSKYREYNTEINNTNEFMSLNKYVKIDDDKAIISKLENITIELINIVKNGGNEARIKEIYDLMYKFYDGKDVTIEGELINKNDLSNGANIASEVFGQITSVYIQSSGTKVVSEKDRESLDNKLKAADRRYRVMTLLETYANTSENIKSTYIDGYDTYILNETDKAIIKDFENLCVAVKEQLTKKGINVTDEQVKSLVLIRNIDYLASDNVSAGVLKTIVNDKELETILSDTTNAINSIESYNMNKKNMDDLYIYSMAMESQNEEQIVNDVALAGAVLTTHNLRNSVNSSMNDNQVLNNDYYQAVKLYNAYSSKSTINSGNLRVTKNDTGMGTRYITDAIYYTTLKTLPYQSEGVNKLVDNSDKGMSSIDSISWAIENKCSEYQFVK